jgi:hypothetical protein
LRAPSGRGPQTPVSSSTRRPSNRAMEYTRRLPAANFDCAEGRVGKRSFAIAMKASLLSSRSQSRTEPFDATSRAARPPGVRLAMAAIPAGRLRDGGLLIVQAHLSEAPPAGPAGRRVRDLEAVETYAAHQRI